MAWFIGSLTYAQLALLFQTKQDWIQSITDYPKVSELTQIPKFAKVIEDYDDCYLQTDC